ncbi:RNA-directed DNA polymerase from mobile element jockey-like [Plakobranchus ocellatus]|uniref:RNA-directed DNA polymerase from mobile element jockey-like n=1 Tax=Plakobranchus ocellatus TaxID=259542 RepID=A0AAV3Y521_9GAST|nr:RNA-directed DNA polymerase from mobile element jockey-like [Plakobranchus ocellatus]
MEDEVRHALSKMKSSKAPGPDDIPSELTTALDKVGIKAVKKLLNNIYDAGEIPTDMKKSIYIAIPKKPGTAECDQHRTINLMSHLTKPIPYNTTPTHLSWERLESLRLRRLGIPNRYSRHCNIVYNSQAAAMNAVEKNRQCSGRPRMDKPAKGNGKATGNSLAPFYTHEKRTCGYFFSRETDNRKKNFGIPPSDLVAWRSSSAAQ